MDNCKCLFNCCHMKKEDKPKKLKMYQIFEISKPKKKVRKINKKKTK